MNLPNKLTVFRMLLVPVIILIALLGEDGWITWQLFGSQLTLTHLLCAILFVIASLTDLLDGKIARSRNLVTTFGKFMDPIADKMLVNSLLILLAYERLIPVLCVLLMTMRDLIVDAVRLMAAQNQIVLAAGPLGKLKTVMQMIAIIACLLNNFPLGWIHINFGNLLMWIATIVSVISGLDYFMKNKAMIFESI